MLPSNGHSLGNTLHEERRMRFDFLLETNSFQAYHKDLPVFISWLHFMLKRLFCELT